MANKYTSNLKDKTREQNKSNAYSYSSSKRTQTTRKYDTVLGKTKGYDDLTKKNKEKRGRKKKK